MSTGIEFVGYFHYCLHCRYSLVYGTRYDAYSCRRCVYVFYEVTTKPFLTRISGAVTMVLLGQFLHSRICESKRALSDWAFFRLDSYGPHHQSNRFYSFCALSGGGRCDGVPLYGNRMTVGSSVLRAFEQRVSHARTLVHAVWWRWT